MPGWNSVAEHADVAVCSQRNGIKFHADDEPSFHERCTERTCISAPKSFVSQHRCFSDVERAVNFLFLHWSTAARSKN